MLVPMNMEITILDDITDTEADDVSSCYRHGIQ